MKRKLFEFVLIPLLFLIALGTLAFLFLLPVHLEKNILPSFGNKLFTSVTGQVFRIGMNKASMGDFNLGDRENIALRIGSITAEYSLSSLKNKKINRVKLNDFTLNLETSDGRVVIPGMNLESITDAKDKKSQHSSAINLGWLPDNFQITNGFINILHKNKRVFIPFDLQITRKQPPDSTSLNVYWLDFQFFPQGEKIDVTGSIDLTNNKGMFDLSADSFNVEQVAFLLGELEEILSFGNVSVRSNMDLRLMPFQLISSVIDCELESININSNGIILGRPAGSAGSGKPLQMKIAGNGQQWVVTAHGSMVKPMASSIVLDGAFLTEDRSAKGSGNILINIVDREVEFNTGKLPLIIKGNSQLQSDFSFNITPELWQTNFKSRSSKKDIEILYGKNTLSARTPSLSIQGKGAADNTQIEVSLDIEDIHASGDDGLEIILPMADLQVFLNQERKSTTASLVDGKFNLSISEAIIKKDSFTVNGDIGLIGNMKPQPFQNTKFPEATGEFIVSNTKANEKKNNVSIKSIKGRIPWQWSMENYEATGDIKVSGISWRMIELGSIQAGIMLNDIGYSFDGSFMHSLPSGLMTNLSGKTEISGSKYLAGIKLHMDSTPFSSLHLGDFDTSLSNYYLKGELGLDGEVRYENNGLSGNMIVKMQKGRFEHPEKNYIINNIDFSVLIPSLPDIRSAQAQQLLFDKASIGDLTFEKGKVIWQLESPDSIFIEEGGVRWGGGRVFTNAVRISPETEELVVPIFCDRLILTEVLTQLGITGAAGEGTVSGRIPLHIRKGNIRFEDGFLYSSPGQGGSVKVAAFDLLSAGIPKNTPQFAQVDFAAEALKNFQYNWVRLLLNSEGEDLIMQMQMDGKPVQSLPFIYDGRTGLLQRADETQKGIHQPIRLDVNFRLPLNRFLGYGGKVQDMMKKMQ